MRLLNSQRSTNDLDYVFIPYKSKKDIVPLLQKAFDGVEGLKFTYKLHSTHARYLLTLKNNFGTFKAKIEINVSSDCPYQPISTAEVSQHYKQLPHVVCIMKLDIALAHKLAAWNERSLMRDIYDAYFIYQFLKVLPDRETLNRRLQKIVYSRGKKEKGPSQITLLEFINHLEKALHKLSLEAIDRELHDYFPPKEIEGLDLKIKKSLSQMIEELRMGS
ncbi:MAG: nucleotidyl transferase AbiEii/AbiGii toxin family protein [Deltaproteobacteria bacterium]|nr:MAG: nucleotidyl transferase AbiEii/AbiGii toxin family protein [Deltaproteobacteria bacterium]